MYTRPLTHRKKAVVPLIFLQGFIILFSGAVGYWIYGKVNGASVPPQTSVVTPMPPSAVVQIMPQATVDNPLEVIEKGVISWEKRTPVAAADVPIFQDAVSSTAQVFKVGIVLSGKYQGGEILMTLLSNEMGGSFLDRILKYKNSYYILKRHSMSQQQDDYIATFYDFNKIGFNDTIELSELRVPENVAGSSKKQTISFVTNDFFTSEVFKEHDLKKQFDTDSVTVWQVQNHLKNGNTFSIDLHGAFIVLLPDDTYARFTYKPALYDVEGYTPQVTWNMGEINKNFYTTTDPGGCGSMNAVSLMDVIDPDKELVQTGSGLDGSPVYEFADQKNKLVTDLYKIYKTQSVASYEKTALLSLAEFKKQHPIFLWRDSFGRYIKFQRSDFQTQTECGKPVIYLYPERTTSVHVEVKPQGGLSYSDPDYGNGWNVVAEPNGSLTNLGDNKTYPYLFWEGRGGAYSSPKTGWVVPRAKVHAFLVEKLSLFGLNEKERADFMEFWEPRMQSAPFYKIGFFGTEAMNELAPLTITPKPDTIIRILMDFEALQRPEKIEEPKNIKTPARRGFTLIEWGGVLR